MDEMLISVTIHESIRFRLVLSYEQYIYYL